jgi:hypothetical protein
LREHAGFLVVFVATALLILHFAGWGRIPTVGDDSVSYLMLAHHFIDPADALLRPWMGYHAHFPPLFPLVLALSGGASNLGAAHVVVAAFAILCVPMIYRYAAWVLRSKGVALGVVLVFLFAPTAWVSIRGIMSESMFLFLSLACLYYHETRLADAPARPSQWLMFGLLLACAYLTRAAGLALVVAYAMHVAIRIAVAKDRPVLPFLLPFVPLALFVAAWLAWRPASPVSAYEVTIASVLEHLRNGPGRYLLASAEALARGWLASFTAESGVHWTAKAAFALAGALGVAGSVMRAFANRLDGWYVLACLAMLLVWLFAEDNMRRLLYPLVPLLLVHAAHCVRVLARRMRSGKYAGRALAVLAALAIVLSLPPWIMVHSKSLERAPVLEDSPYTYADITDFYTAISIKGSHAVAARHVAALAGLESIERLTPPGAKVMWMRPEYVALLGHREGVPWYYDWDARRVGREIRERKVDYLVVAALHKADLGGSRFEPTVTLEWVLKFSRPVRLTPSAVPGNYDFALLHVDAAALDAYLARPD